MRRSREPRRRSRFLPFGAIAAGLLLVLLASLASMARAPRQGAVRYLLTWDWGRAELGAAGWRTRNDLGYTIELTRGLLVSHSAALVACPLEERRPLDRLLDRLLTRTSLAPATAWAGHAEIGAEPTQVEAPVVEPLERPEPIEIGRAQVHQPATAYCQAHYAIGASEGKRLRLAEGHADPAGASLLVEGRYWRGSEAPTAFRIESDLAWGAMGRIVAASGPAEAGLRASLDGAELEIHIARDLGAIFDGLDFQAMDEALQAKAMLMALTDSTRFLLMSGPSRPSRLR